MVRNVDHLSTAISQSWRQNVLIHPSTTNPEIERLLYRCRPWYQSAKLLGAGGGGYALFVSATAADAKRLKEYLATAPDVPDGARVVDFSLNREGLQVTVS